VIEATCHCGAVRIEVTTAPTELTDCNCSICRRMGTLWSYHPIAEVRVTGATATYQWGDRTVEFHRCTNCGCVTHWSPTPSGERMGVNSRLMEPAVIKGVRVRRLDGADTWKFLDE
jgi:hypothetical protein